jgi:hypothetical protein
MTVMMYRCLDRLMLGSMLMAMACAGCGRAPKIPTASVSGTVTINGKGVPSVEVAFVPTDKIRPAYGITDASGHYAAQFLTSQSGVPLGECVVQISYRPNGGFDNILPAQYNEKAADNPALRLTVPKEGTTFNYDVKMEGMP